MILTNVVCTQDKAKQTNDRKKKQNKTKTLNKQNKVEYIKKKKKKKKPITQHTSKNTDQHS